MAEDTIAPDGGARNRSEVYNAYVVWFNGDIKYVGITVKSVSARWRQHLHNAKKATRKSVIYHAMRKHGSENFAAEHVVCCLSSHDLNAVEQILISQYSTFENGYNLTTGGGQGFIVSDRTRVLLADSSRGRKLSDASIAKMSASKKGRPISPESLEKMISAIRGKKRKPESLAKASASLRGRVFSDETRQRMSDAHMGKKRSAESSKKTGDALRGRKRSPEVVARMVANKMAAKLRRSALKAA